MEHILSRTIQEHIGSQIFAVRESNELDLLGRIVHNYILRVDIQVNNIARVQMIQRLQDLLDMERHLVLLKQIAPDRPPGSVSVFWHGQIAQHMVEQTLALDLLKDQNEPLARRLVRVVHLHNTLVRNVMQLIKAIRFCFDPLGVLLSASHLIYNKQNNKKKFIDNYICSDGIVNVLCL